MSNRSELLGEIKHHEALIKEHKNNLSTTVKYKRVMKQRYFSNSEAVILILNTLKKLNRPTKTHKISNIIASKKGLILESDYEKSTFQKAVVASLSISADNNLVERVGRDGVTVVWQIKEIA